MHIAIESYPTQAVTVKAMLYDRLKAALPDTEVYYNDPVDGFGNGGSVVFLGNIEWSDESAVSNRSREEVYDIDLFINVQEDGGDPAELEARVFQLFAIVEKYLRENPIEHFGKHTNLECKPERASGFPNPSGYESQIQAVIRCTSRK